MGEYTAQFKEVTRNQSIDEQAMTFLKSFVGEFQGKFEEVLKLGEEFKTFCAVNQKELDEFEAHRFLESRGETKTVRDMRQELQEIDIDSNNRVAFIEYLLFRYKKTPKQLFEAKPNAALVAKLERAVAQYRAVFEEKAAREAKMNELRAQVQAGGAGAARAKAELRRMEMEDPANEAKDEMAALHAKMAAKRALRNPKEEEDRMYEEEQARLAEERRRQEDEEKAKKAASRSALKARAALWN